MILERLLDSLPHLAALCVLTCVSGLISASETALFSLTRQQLGRFRQSPRRAEQLVLRLREDPDGLLSTVLLANISVNILLYSFLAVTVSRIAEASAGWALVFGVVGFSMVLLGAEILPKMVAFAASERLAPLAAVPIRVLQTVSRPVRWILGVLLIEPLTRILAGGRQADPAVRAEELQQLVNICQKQGLIDERENVLLHGLMELADRRVSELMVPRVDVVAFDLSRDKSELIGLIKDNRLLRIPVYEGDIDKVKGVILSKDFLLNPDRSPARLIRPVRFIPEQASVEALLELFRRTGSKLALVVDEYGGIAGIVALEDIVEAIVGEIHAPDEPDALPELQQIDDTTYIVDAGLDVDDFCRVFNLPIEESRIHTVAGLMSEKLDRLPEQGDQLTLGHARLTVISLKDHRILRIRLSLERPAEDTPELRRLLGLSVTGTHRADPSHRSGA